MALKYCEDTGHARRSIKYRAFKPRISNSSLLRGRSTPRRTAASQQSRNSPYYDPLYNSHTTQILIPKARQIENMTTYYTCTVY